MRARTATSARPSRASGGGSAPPTPRGFSTSCRRRWANPRVPSSTVSTHAGYSEYSHGEPRRAAAGGGLLVESPVRGVPSSTLEYLQVRWAVAREGEGERASERASEGWDARAGALGGRRLEGRGSGYSHGALRAGRSALSTQAWYSEHSSLVLRALKLGTPSTQAWYSEYSLAGVRGARAQRRGPPGVAAPPRVARDARRRLRGRARPRLPAAHERR
jgi:hypothetical protein